ADRGWSQDDVGFELDHLLRKPGQPILITIGETIHHVEVASFDIPKVPHTSQKIVDEILGGFTSGSSQPGNESVFGGNLRPRGNRLRHSRAAEQRYELASFQLIQLHWHPASREHTRQNIELRGLVSLPVSTFDSTPASACCKVIAYVM